MLKEYCEKAVETALEIGSNEAEAYMQKKHSFLIEFSNGALIHSIERESRGIGVRIIQHRATGFAYSTQVENIEIPVSQAIKSAQLVAPDTFFQSLPEPRPVPHLCNIYDYQLSDLQIDDVQHAVSEIIGRIEKGTGTFQIILRECSVANSRGISVEYRKSDCSLRFSVARNVAASYCNFSHLNVGAFTTFLKEISEKKNLPERREKWSGNGQIILEPNAVTDFIRPLIAAMNGKNIVEKRSHLLDRRNEIIVSDEISLYDDGCYPNGLLTQPVDGEGVPSQKTCLIEKGVLQNYIYDSYYAHQSGEESTGNAVRKGFTDLPSCLFTNLIFCEGSASRNELIEDTSHGILINSLGTSMVNPNTSRFALPISKGFLIEKGVISAALYPTILTGDILSLLRNVVVSREREQIFRFLNPWIKIRI